MTHEHHEEKAAEVPATDSPTPEVSEDAADLTKQQLEDMAVAFTKAIAKIDARLTEQKRQRAVFAKKLRAVQGRLTTIAINEKAGM